jgi:hypothetical protein
MFVLFSNEEQAMQLPRPIHMYCASSKLRVFQAAVTIAIGRLKLGVCLNEE